jgi:hypothetical protein
VSGGTLADGLFEIKQIPLSYAMINLPNETVGRPWPYCQGVEWSEPVLGYQEFPLLKLPLCPNCGKTETCRQDSYGHPDFGEFRSCQYRRHEPKTETTDRFWCTDCSIEWTKYGIRDYRDLK